VQRTVGQDSLPQKKEPVIKQKLWCDIFASFYTTANGNTTPKSAFGMPTALLGYSATMQNRVKGTLIFDVYRTTNNISVTDSNGNFLNVNYNEGSKYTVFLKLAEIKYSPTPFLDLHFGQILNTQYLTTQDKFWGYRYVYFTFQEIHRYGNPADFGFQADLKFGNKILNQMSITNGEGPMKFQDENGKFLFSNNLEVYPLKGLLLKLYADYAPKPDTSAISREKNTISIFAGYKNEKFRLATEWNKVWNYNYRQNSDFYGISTFGSYALGKQFNMFLRYDYVNKSVPLNLDKAHIVLFGVEYEPLDNFQCAFHVRNVSQGKLVTLNVNVGLRF
jgi:hypothetical protein